MKGDVSAALEDFNKALSLDPDYNDAKENKRRAVQLIQSKKPN